MPVSANSISQSNNTVNSSTSIKHSIEENKDTKKESDSTLPHISGSKAGESLSSVNNVSQEKQSVNSIISTKYSMEELENNSSNNNNLKQQQLDIIINNNQVLDI